LDSGPGGEYIIDEEDLFPSDPLGSFHDKGAADVFLPFRAGKPGLGLGVVDTQERCKIQRDGAPAADPAGQKQ